MAELLKNIYNDAFFERFSEAIKELDSNFNTDLFLEKIYSKQWASFELKQRMRHISITLNAFLSGDFEKDAATLLSLIPVLLKHQFKANNLEFMFLPDYIELYGEAHLKKSIYSLERITQFVSCEFAVRPFIINHPTEMIAQMKLWSNHPHASVRRLSSEGSRPRLPWAMALPFLKEDPTSILPILANLKSDNSEYVRRSVANNLNDISKDNPQIVIDIVKSWYGKMPETNALLKHGSRTLLKQGNPPLMTVFGFGSVENIQIDDFKISNLSVPIGGVLVFSFQLNNKNDKSTKIRLEYGLYYQKQNGTLAKKVYKISEKEYLANSITAITRKQSFKIITTRKFHLGKHQVAIIVNGKEFELLDFNLVFNP
jgi:3-methyladenine DNA glycosylase AlkC